jgi:hypothetical protein
MNMSEPPISAVITTYRRPAMLRRAISSVLNQTFRDFRLCVYDDASGDETEQVVDEFRRKDARVEYFRRPSRIGRAANFQDSGNRVETEFFSFLPDDDIMLPEFFATALEEARRYPQAALSILPTLIMKPDGFVLGATALQWPEGLIPPPQGMFACLHYGNLGLPSLLIRREVWREFAGFDDGTDPLTDLDFSLRVTSRLPVVVSRRPGGIQIIHPGSNTTLAEGNWFWPQTPRMIQNLTAGTNLTSPVKNEVTAFLTKWMQRTLITHCVMRSIGQGRWEKAMDAADVLVEASGRSRSARMVRAATSVCRRLPGVPLSVRAFLALRAGEKTLRNLGLHWRYRGYARNYLHSC